jgi:hypothetical protein
MAVGWPGRLSSPSSRPPIRSCPKTLLASWQPEKRRNPRATNPFFASLPNRRAIHNDSTKRLLHLAAWPLLFKSEQDVNALTGQKTEARKGRMPTASFGSGQVLEKAQNGNGRLLEKVGMDLGLAPCRLGVGAASAWTRRDSANSQRDKSIGLCPCIRASNKGKMHNAQSVHANSRREPAANAISACRDAEPRA